MTPPGDGLPQASELPGGATRSSTVAPNVGQPPVVDDEVVWRGDRRSIRDTGCCSMDRSTESRLTTPGNRQFTTIKENRTVSGVSPTVLCDDSRRTRAPKMSRFEALVEESVTVPRLLLVKVRIVQMVSW